MKKKPSHRGCLLWILLLFLLMLAAGGGLWLYQSRSLSFDGAVITPVVVTITSPANGDDVYAGDFVPVSAQAISPEGIRSMELFLDGQSLGKVTDPSNALWTWQAWPLGVHSFYAQATDAKGQAGYSQVVIVNVIAGDGTMEVNAGEGQTLEQIGAGYGIPPDQMTGANPNLPPSQPLPGGNPVQVPVNTIEPPNVPDSKFISIKWKIKITEKVDKAYCYVSTGNGVWEKIPKGPFTYFYGQENFYTQLIPYNTKANIQMQCWGWVGGTLKYLGQAEKALDPSQSQGEITVGATGFVFAGFFKMPEIEPVKTLQGNKATIPPPFALREPSSAAECASHGDPIVVPLLCNGVMNAKMKENITLIWEWQPAVCVFGFCNYGVGEIAGYGVYEVDPAKQTFVLIADIKSSAMRVAFPPLPWGGGKCYGVEAYVDYPGSQVSGMATYCLGEPPKTQKLTLTPSQWLTAGGQWIQDGDCDSYGLADSYKLANQQDGFGNQAGQVLAGSYLVDDDDEDCYREGNYSGAVKFDLQLKLPTNAVIQKAELTFSKVFMDYGATGLAAPSPSSCVKNLGKASQDWTGLSDSIHFTGKNILGGPAYFSPIQSMSPYLSLHADVTSAVKEWVKTPSKNHGFILTPAGAPDPYGDGTGSCLSGLGNFNLNIYYFVQP